MNCNANAYGPYLITVAWIHLQNALNAPPNAIVYGEPINAIISASSDPRVLINQDTHGGLGNYFQSLGFTIECFGISLGDDEQAANLGDGQSWGKFCCPFHS